MKFWKWFILGIVGVLMILMILFFRFCERHEAYTPTWQQAPGEFFFLYNEGKLVEPNQTWGNSYRLEVSGLFSSPQAEEHFDLTEVLVFNHRDSRWVERTEQVENGSISTEGQGRKVVVLKPKGTLLKVYEHLLSGYRKFQNGQYPALDKDCNELLMLVNGEAVFDAVDVDELPRFDKAFESRNPEIAYERISHACVDFGVERRIFPVEGNHERGLSGGTTPEYLQLVNMIPPTISCEKFNDKEPYLFSSRNGQELYASIISKNINEGSGNGPLYTSLDGGETWEIAYIVKGVNKPTDITTVMGYETGGFISSLLKSKDDGFSHYTMSGVSVNESIDQIESYELEGDYHDQPHLAMEWKNGEKIVAMGYNDLHSDEIARSAKLNVMVSARDWHTYAIGVREAKNNYAPTIRPAIAKDGTVYAAMVRRTEAEGDVKNTNRPSELIVVREDDLDLANLEAADFADLTDPSDNEAGKIVATDLVYYSGNDYGIGNHRTGGHLSLAVHPNQSSTVYVAWANITGAGRNNMHLWRSTNRGETWTLVTTFTNVVAPALDVSDDGTVGFLYHQLSGVEETSRNWKVKLWQWNPTTGQRSVTLLANPVLNYNLSSDPTTRAQPRLGEYAGLDWSNGTFKGVFIAHSYGAFNPRYYPKTPKMWRNPNPDTDPDPNSDEDVVCTDPEQANDFRLSFDPYFFEVKSI